MTPYLPSFLLTEPPPVSPSPSAERLRALSASTSAQRTANPTGYAANAAWWAGILQSTLRSGWINGEDGDRLILALDDVTVGRYEWDGVRPKGLAGFVERLAMTSPPILHPLPYLLSSPTPLHAPASLTSRYIGRPLWWALGQLNPFGGGEREVGEDELWKRYGKGREYVHMPLLEDAVDAFTAYMSDHPLLSYSSSLHNLSSFREEFGRVCFPGGMTGLPQGTHRLGKRDCEVLAKWLERDCAVLVSDGSVIKLLEPGESASEHAITEADRGTLSILQTLKKVDAQMDDIEAQINSYQAKAKSCIASSQRSLALSALKSKKALEDLLEKRLGVADQLRGVIRSIDQAKGDVEIMRAYTLSTITLSSILQHPSLSPDRIAQTTDALADTLADASEIDEAIRVGGKVAVGGAVGMEVEEADLGRELEGLVAEEKERVERERVEREMAERDRRENEERRRAAKVMAERVDLERREREREDAERRERADLQRRLAELDRRRGEARPPSAEETTAVLEGGLDRQIPGDAGQAGSAKPVATGDAGAARTERYEAAQQREREERARAEAERLKRDERRMVAE